MSSSMAPRVLDLFAGAGGLSCGLLNLGLEPKIVAVEVDGDSCETFARNHHGAIVHNCTVAEFLDRGHEGRFDLIIGGPPCQGFSQLGKQDNGDDRNELWSGLIEAVSRYRPRAFLIENVPNFVKSESFERLKARVNKLGQYSLNFRILNANDFGSPQARKRAFIVGWRSDLKSPFSWPGEVENKGSLREAIGDLPTALFGDEWGSAKSFRSGLELHVGRKYTELSLRRFRAIPLGGNRFDLPFELQANCWKKHTSGSADVMGRLHWDKPAVTIRTEFFKPEKGRYIHPEQDRALTHLEAARIQGFPSNYSFYGSRSSVARQIGNAVPVQLASALLGSIILQVEQRDIAA